MLDIDEITSHLIQFGAYELDRNEFLQRMKDTLASESIWFGNELSSNIVENEIQLMTKPKKMLL